MCDEQGMKRVQYFWEAVCRKSISLDDLTYARTIVAGQASPFHNVISDSKVRRANIWLPGSCRPQVGPMMAPWTWLSGWVYSTWLQTMFPQKISRRYTNWGQNIYTTKTTHVLWLDISYVSKYTINLIWCDVWLCGCPIWRTKHWRRTTAWRVLLIFLW